MNRSSTPLTVSTMIATACAVLLDNHYRLVSSGFREWDTPTSRLFENEYAIVGVVVFETSRELLQSWPDMQALLVGAISKHIGRRESKSWDGYLVLLTPGVAPSGDEEIERVKYDTTRLRKIVATGEDLLAQADLERVLSALLPLGLQARQSGQRSALDLLPKLLATRHIPEETTQLLVDAFLQDSPLMECLDRNLREK